MIKEEYKNIPDAEFVPLKDGVDSVFWNKYEINKLGDIKCIQSGIITKSVKSKNGHYPRKSFRVGEFKKAYLIHRLVAITFLVPEPNKEEVDHIDRNKENYKLSNLRWSSRNENLLNREFSSRMGKAKLLKLDESGQIVEEIDYFSILKKKRDYINQSIKDNKKAFGYFWKKEINELSDFIKEYNINLEKEQFIPILRFPKLLINKYGLIKRNNEYVVGWKDDKGYRKISIESHPYFIHRLVFETFSNALLSQNDVIDHIDTNTLNNTFTNLRKVTQKENMNNELTKAKLSKKVLKYSLDGVLLGEFKTLTEACESIGIHRDNNCIKLCCEGKLSKSHGFKWKYA